MLRNPAAAAHFGLSLGKKILPLVRPQAKTGPMGASGLPKLPLREALSCVLRMLNNRERT